MNNNIVKSAIYFADNNFHVFPLLKNLINGKNKIGTPRGWNHNRPEDSLSVPSTKDIHEISAWGDVYGANLIGYGVHPRERRALILDVDVKDGKQGLESLNRLIHDFDLEKASFAVRSKSGGLHLYYQYPNTIDNIIGLPLPDYPHIDIRSENTFVVGPSSFGNKYTIKYGSLKEDLKPLPENFIKILPRKSNIQTQSTSLIAVNSNDMSLTGKIPDIIQVGERDNSLIRLIGSWVRTGLSKDNVIILTKEAIKRCDKAPNEAPITINDYIDKIENTIEKTAFSRPHAEPLQFFLDNMVYVKVMGGVYEIHTRTLYIKDLPNHYAPHVYFVEQEDSKGNIKYKEMSAFSQWMKNKKRKNVHNIGYRPCNDHIFYDDVQNHDVVNMYRSSDLVDIKKLDDKKLKYTDIFEKFIDFCTYLFGKKAELMIEWAAHQIQHPEIKLAIAPVMISESRGVGKNLFFDILSSIVGKHNTSVLTSDSIIESHNDYIIRNHLVLINEAYTPSVDRWSKRSKNQTIEKIKMLITDHSQHVNPKYVPPFIAKSYVNYIFASNNLDAVPVESGDRRFEIIIIDELPKEKSYYAPLWEATNNSYEGRLLSAKIKQGLLSIKIKTINAAYTAQYDAEKLAVMMAGLSNVETSIQMAINNNYRVFKQDVVIFELFMWFVVTEVDPTISLEYGRSLFKMFCRPIYFKQTRRAKQLTLSYPPLTIKGNYVPGGKGKRSIFSCRRHSYYNRKDNPISNDIMIAQYKINFDSIDNTEKAKEVKSKIVSKIDEFKS